MGADKVTEALERALRALRLAATKGAARADVALEELMDRTREQLVAAARALDVRCSSKLRKVDLARRLLDALRGADEAPPAPAAAPPDPEPDPSATAKLDLGPGAPVEALPRDIPWSYGVDRVTAAAVDPARLFVYWELTDPAIERARAALGAGGRGAWINLRVYDTTGRLFDGTNAHAYFDHRVERSDRQWFFAIGKPTSTAFVEVGLRSSEGFFARIARSGRVDFPRTEPAPWREPEWMTVLATGEAQHAGRGAPRGGPEPAPAPGAPAATPPAAASGADAVGAPGGFTPFPLWAIRDWRDARELHRQLVEAGWQRVEWRSARGETWVELQGRSEWYEPALVTSWEAGPFTYPVEVAPPRSEAWEGPTLVYRVGDVTHVVSGPWQVVIRNLGAHASRAVLGRWEVYRWWSAGAGAEAPAVAAARGSPAGASEQAAPAGASERRWAAASELRLVGASELWRMGASEVHLRGASERLHAGASEWALRGASEQRAAGASEVRLRGASEQRLGGGSEARIGGASDARLGGASDRLAAERAAPAADYPSPDAVSPAATE